MALSILFWLRKSAANSKGFAPLKVRLTLPNKDICDFSSGLTAEVKAWNPVKKKVSGTSADAARVNLYISRSEAKLKDIYDSLARDDRDISAEVIKNIFLGKLQQRITILGALNDHTVAFREQIAITGKLEESTALKFDLLAEKLKKFMLQKYNRKDYFVNDLDHAFVQDFRNWLLMYGHKDGTGLAADSATGWLKRLRKITLNLFKRSLMKQDPFVDIKLSWLTPSATGINETELQKFEALKLKDAKLQMVKDRFIVSCYSGLSHEDLSRCKRDDLVKNFGSEQLWIKVFRKKTGGFCKIPVMPPVQAIIDKYWNDAKCVAENRLFPLIGLQGMNRYLKILGDIAGIEKILTSHCGRHYFSVMALNNGVSLQVISEILGHSSVKMTASVYARTNHTLVSSEMKAFSEKRFPVMKIVESDKKIG